MAERSNPTDSRHTRKSNTGPRKTTLYVSPDLHQWVRIYAARWDTTFQDIAERTITEWATAHGFSSDAGADEWQYRRVSGQSNGEGDAD
ncbi:MAG: hypothetical protein ACRDHP_05490 [Ktedonobacterales bacterium]